MNEFLKKVTDNAYSFSIIAKILSIATGFVYSVLYSRYLGAELRGTASVINNYAEMIMLVLCFGIYQAYPYYKNKTGEARYNEFIDKVFGLFFLYSAIVCMLIAAVRPAINVCVISILIPLQMAIRQLNYVVLIENPKLRNLAQIWLDLFDVAFLAVLMLFTTANYLYCVAFLIIKNIVFFVIAVANLKIPVLSIRPTLKGIMPYIKYGFVPMITIILMEVNYKVDVLMLERLGISNADIGVYSLGVMLAQKLWMIPDALKDILTSKLAGGKTKDEVCKVTRISFCVTVISVIGMVMLGKPFILLLFGKEYSGAYLVLLVIVLGVLGMVFYKMIYAFNVVNGRKNINFLLLAIAAAANIVLNFALIPVWGIMGAAFASMVSYCVCGIGFLMDFTRHTHMPVSKLIWVEKKDIQQLMRYIRK